MKIYSLNFSEYAKNVVPATLPSSLGRIQFAEGQLHGRAGKLAMADIRELGQSEQQAECGNRRAPTSFFFIAEPSEHESIVGHL